MAGRFGDKLKRIGSHKAHPCHLALTYSLLYLARPLGSFIFNLHGTWEVHTHGPVRHQETMFFLMKSGDNVERIWCIHVLSVQHLSCMDLVLPLNMIKILCSESVHHWARNWSYFTRQRHYPRGRFARLVSMPPWHARHHHCSKNHKHCDITEETTSPNPALLLQQPAMSQSMSQPASASTWLSPTQNRHAGPTQNLLSYFLLQGSSLESWHKRPGKDTLCPLLITTILSLLYFSRKNKMRVRRKSH
jgi:hypothetical protein